MHRRAAIRGYFVAALTGGASGAKVTQGLAYPEQIEGLPAFDIGYAGEELLQPTSDALQSFDLGVVVTLRASGASYLDAIDALALEAQTAIMADHKLGGLVDHTLSPEAQELEIVGDLDMPAGAMPLLFSVRYTVTAADPQ